MTIDEVIMQAREKADKNSKCWERCTSEEDCETCERENEQLATWLEELKAIKDGSIPIIHGKAELELHDKAIRNEAIDDFANWLVEQGILGSRCISDGEITDYGRVYAKKYKEQLKEQKK